VSRLAGYPTGLLDLVGSQSFGIAPKDLSDIVGPIVDLTGLYMLTKQVAAIAIMAAPANGTNATKGLIVPAGEVWSIRAGGVFVGAGVGVSGDFTPTMISNGLTVALGATTPVAASTTRWLEMTMGPIFLKAGDELTCHISLIAGAPTVSIQYLVAKFRA